MPHKNKEAGRIWRRSWWASRPDMRNKQRISSRSRARDLRAYLGEIKIATGCVDCGYKQHPAALDFDHITGLKERLVSFCKSRAQADLEIAKCEVRCSNCHRIKTWERRPNKQPICKPDIFQATYEAVE